MARETIAQWSARLDAERAERRRLPAHLDYVELHEFTENIPREHGEERSGRCQAWPAKIFQRKYPEGCLRHMSHQGAHSAVEATAKRMDARDGLRR